MARAARDTKLETRSNRMRLETGKRYFLAMADGLSLMYRRTSDGYGTWSARIVDTEDKERLRKIGPADDYLDADGMVVFNFTQAQARCRELEMELKDRGPKKPITVAEAASHYLAWYKDHRKAFRETENTVNAHILPALGQKVVSELKAPEIRAWLNKLATNPPRRRTRGGEKQQFGDKPATDIEKRSRKATANRIFTVLKAMLNKAFHDDLVKDDTTWRKVKPFENVDEPVTRFLTHAEATRLINACRPDFRELVKAALFTGARYGELTRLKPSHVNTDTALVYVTAEAKSGKGRYVPLHDDALDFFAGRAAGRPGDSLLFTKQDGREWGKNHHVRLLQTACEQAKIEPAIGFHELRHTYASTLAQLSVDLLTISKLLGHADTRITSRHYAHLCDKTLAEAVKKLPSFGHKRDEKIVAIR